MRSKLHKSARVTPRQMQSLMVCQFNQSKDKFFCLMAYFRVFVKPKLIARSRRQGNFHGSVVSVVLASFRASMELRLNAVKDHINIGRQEHEKTLYWLHAGNPYPIRSLVL